MSKRIICKHIDQQLDHIKWDLYALKHCDDHTLLNPICIYILTALMCAGSSHRLLIPDDRHIKYLIDLGLITNSYDHAYTFNLNPLGHQFVEQYLPHYQLLKFLTLPLTLEVCGHMHVLIPLMIWWLLIISHTTFFSDPLLRIFVNMIIVFILIMIIFGWITSQNDFLIKPFIHHTTKANFVDFLTDNYNSYQLRITVDMSSVVSIIDHCLF